MSIQSIKQHKQWFVSAAILLAVAGVFLARTAFARVVSNTIAPVGIVADNGRQLRVSGPLVSDTAGEKVLLRVTVTQRTTGAFAEGVSEFAANGSFATNQWHVLATAQGGAAFEPGPATAVGVAVTSTRGQATDAHQWLVNITLVKE
jgi:hypothetical protein